ncbi:MAG TPA: lysophospholipid acyltransferase family protein [Roseiflexaceae bacterium]|nr:lysophospholipid acyltransferase family protein [Roseiflexaceae bacterium]
MLGAIMFFILWFPLNVCRVLWWNWKVEGIENLPPRPQGCVLAVNHLHWTDIHIVGASMPLSHRPWWIAKIELFNGRLITWWFREMQVIPIRRGKRDMAALAAAEEALRAGAPLMIFPEGHRSDTGQLQEGKSGAVRLALRSRCPIVPIAVFGTEAGLKGAVTRKPIRVRIGAPYMPQAENPDRVSPDKMQELTDEMMMRIAALMPEKYWGFYREKMLRAGLETSGERLA